MKIIANTFFIIILLAFAGFCQNNNRGKQELNKKLFVSAQKGNDAEVAKLLARGTDPNMTDPDDTEDNPDYGPKTVLEAAIESGSLRCVELLFAKGAIYNNGSEKLHLMCMNENDNVEMVKLLVKNKADVNYADLGGDLPLVHAVVRGNVAITMFLISKGAKYESMGKKINSRKALALAKENYEKRSIEYRETTGISFKGKYTDGSLGFEGSSYTISLEDEKKNGISFYCTAEPEIAFFTISEETGMPATNKDLVGKTFTVYYNVEEIKDDATGENRTVNMYQSAEINEQ
jgi:ankyrin repeat protein